MISAILAIIIVNTLYKFYMWITGASAMFYSGKKKLGYMFLVWGLLFSILGI